MEAAVNSGLKYLIFANFATKIQTLLRLPLRTSKGSRSLSFISSVVNWPLLRDPAVVQAFGIDFRDYFTRV